MCFPEKPKVLQGKKKFNYYSHFSSQDSHMTRRHYISHKRLGSAHSPGLPLVGDVEKSSAWRKWQRDGERERESVCLCPLTLVYVNELSYVEGDDVDVGLQCDSSLLLVRC